MEERPKLCNEREPRNADLTEGGRIGPALREIGAYETSMRLHRQTLPPGAIAQRSARRRQDLTAPILKGRQLVTPYII